jgi:hypothetical protein
MQVPMSVVSGCAETTQPDDFRLRRPIAPAYATVTRAVHRNLFPASALLSFAKTGQLPPCDTLKCARGGTGSRNKRSQKDVAMFCVDWLNGTAAVESEISALTDVQLVIETARGRAVMMKKRHPEAEPTCFQVSDKEGGLVAVYPV